VISRSEMISMMVSNPSMMLVMGLAAVNFGETLRQRLGRCLRQRRSSLTLLGTGADLA